MKAVSLIESNAILLVYPIDNRPEPRSLWSEFFPKSRMRWEWDTDGDDRVASLWRLREELSRSGKVVYAKWYQGRATFFSRELFTDLLAVHRTADLDRARLSPEARLILSTLESDSPLSTKELKAATDLRGKLLESTYEKAMRELWRLSLIVGYGERDDGAFPSLLVGATRHHFEDLWDKATGIDPTQARARVESRLKEDPPFLKFFRKLSPS